MALWAAVCIQAPLLYSSALSEGRIFMLWGCAWREMNGPGPDRDLCDVDRAMHRVSPNRLAADLADVSDEAGSPRERDASARHEPGLLWELPRSAPWRLARDEANRGRSKDLSARGATTHPTRGADPALSAASAQSAARLLGLTRPIAMSTSRLREIRIDVGAVPASFSSLMFADAHSR